MQYEEKPAVIPTRKKDQGHFKLSKREVIFIFILALFITAAGVFTWRLNDKKQEQANAIDSFEECIAAGNPVMESYPEQCTAGGRTFTNPTQQVQLP
ncbi:MAG: hypothetical protein M3Q14_01230 [bacterium]|nr:hypothetical protein [bacterium]